MCIRDRGRADQWKELLPDPDAGYDERAEIDLSELEPLVAMPDMPDKVAKVSELGHVKVGQVFIGSCTNASYTDFVKAARILDGTVSYTHLDVYKRQMYCTSPSC